MGLENLKSVFTEGMSKFNNTDVTTITSNYGLGGDFTQPDVFGDGHLFQQNFEELNQTQLKGMESTFTGGVGEFNINPFLTNMNSRLTIGGGIFTQDDVFGDGTLFQHHFEELSQTQLTRMSSDYSDVDGIFSQPDVFGDTILFQQNMYPDGVSQLLDLNGTSVFQQGMGGLFNTSTTYESSKFIPMSALNVPSIEQILTSGNVGDLSRGIPGAGGFPLQKTSYDKLDVTNSMGEDLNISEIPIRTFEDISGVLFENRKSPNDSANAFTYSPVILSHPGAL